MLLSRSTSPIHGRGLFSGQPASITFHPHADGIIIRCPAPIPALTANVTPKPTIPGIPPQFPIRNTTLATPTAQALTIEHAMSALAGLGITAAAIELTGGEVPILDGSAHAFAQALAPLRIPGPTPQPITLAAPIEVREGDAFIKASPRAAGFSYTYELDYGPTSPIPRQSATWSGDPHDYLANIAPARTFSLSHEAAVARAAGLFTSFTPADLLVIAPDGNPVDNAWRFDTEPARHKLLDLIGDLALLSRPLHADITAHKAGHALTHKFCKAVLELSVSRRPA